MTTLNKNCQIHNNTNVAIAVLDTYNKAAKKTDILYECVPSILPTLSGQKTIAAAKSDKVKLNDYVPDDVTNPALSDTVYSTDYQLVLAQPSNLFPVKYVDEMLHFSTKTYPDITVAQKDQDTIKLAYQLYQFLSAYPTSKLAKGFYNALDDAFNKSESAADIEKIIADFLKKTKQYQTLDAPSFAAVMSYITSYPNCFVLVAKDKKNYLVYYLYSAPSTTDEKAAPVFEGRLVFSDKKTPRPAVADPTDANGGYNIRFYSASGDEIDLSYNQGQFVSDTTQDFPDICLQGSFLNKRYLTGNKKDNQLIPILVGVISGAKVLGTTDKQHGNVKTDPVFQWPSLLLGLISLLLTLAALLLSLYLGNKAVHFLRQEIREVTAKLRGKTGDDNIEPSRREFDETRERIRYTDLPSSQAAAQENMNRACGSDKDVPQVLRNKKQFSDAVKTVRFKVQKQLVQNSARYTEDGVNELEKQLNVLSKYMGDAELNHLYENVEKMKNYLEIGIENLNKAKTSEIDSRIKELTDTVDNSNAFLNKAMQETQKMEHELGDAISEADKAEMRRCKDVIEGLMRNVKEAREDQKRAEDGEMDDDAGTEPVPDYSVDPISSWV